VPKPAAQHGVASRHFWRVLAVISEHGIFHGISNQQTNKPLNTRDKNGLFTIE
jgi:hypothetical protein